MFIQYLCTSIAYILIAFCEIIGNLYMYFGIIYIVSASYFLIAFREIVGTI